METDIRQLHPADMPPLLREIPDAPSLLYLRGTLPPREHKLLAVVGSRQYSGYGKEVCEHLMKGLAGSAISIVSGLALGIDGIAHRAALRAGLHTIAVPGSGLDPEALYPRAHARLAEEILVSGGALLSEFSPSFRARPESFPQRNRIMAGLCHATLIIEATQKSGTLITARLAMEYNREVLVVPGSIFGATAYGPHLLIRNGATPTTSAEDILEALGMARETGPAPKQGLSEREALVMKLLASPLSRDTLVAELGLSISDANVLLSAMELKGLITESLGEVHRA